jgi:hypothetical protein
VSRFVTKTQVERIEKIWKERNEENIKLSFLSTLSITESCYQKLLPKVAQNEDEMVLKLNILRAVRIMIKFKRTTYCEKVKNRLFLPPGKPSRCFIFPVIWRVDNYSNQFRRLISCEKNVGFCLATLNR